MSHERTARLLARRVAWSARAAAAAAGLVVACSGSAVPYATTLAEPTTIASTTRPDPSSSATDSTPVIDESPVDAGERVGLRMVSQNILHGLECPAETSRCRLADRVALFMGQLGEADCPQVVSLQEVNADVVAAIEPHLPTCGYDLVWDRDEGIDRELVLTTLDVIDSRRISLAGGFRTAFAVRLDTDFGPLDVIGTHLSSSSDNGPCDATLCPAPCDAGTGSLRDCQARQVVEIARQLASDAVVTVVGGDLNARAGDPAHDVMLSAGFVDSHLAAGRAECGAGHELSCTSGRASTSMVDLTDPASLQRERIDYWFVDGRADRCEIGDETGPFNAEAEAGPIAHPSDHTGVLLELTCTMADGTATPSFPTTITALPDEPTTGDRETVAAVVAAYETVFDGAEPDVERRLAHLEDRDRLRGTFLAQLDAAGELAASTSARVESVSVTSATTADVVFSILLDGSVVFDRLTGTAVQQNGTWLVSASTFCELVAEAVPAATGC